MRRIVQIGLAAALTLGAASLAQAQNVVKIGQIEAQTGANAIYGWMSSQGAPIAVDEINKAGGFKVGDTTYKLLQVHFHRPSEHLVNGRSYPMEAHFVHRADSGALAVVGVMFSEGKPNATFGKIIATMPAKEGPAVKADAAINPNGLLPAKLGYYRYPGSLTTPPCSEVVEWLVLTDPIQVAASDVAGFAKLYPMNARPAQKDNRRYVLQSR